MMKLLSLGFICLIGSLSMSGTADAQGYPGCRWVSVCTSQNGYVSCHNVLSC